MPRRKKTCPKLTVHVSFEATRLSSQCLIAAYECLAPTQAPHGAGGLRAPLFLPRRARTQPGREGKHA